MLSPCGNPTSSGGQSAEADAAGADGVRDRGIAPFFLGKGGPGALKSFFSPWLIDLLDAGADMRRASQINEHVMRRSRSMRWWTRLNTS
jgi:hypothetical protein